MHGEAVGIHESNVTVTVMEAWTAAYRRERLVLCGSGGGTVPLRSFETCEFACHSPQWNAKPVEVECSNACGP
jgi:hypothetical protein